MASYRVNHKAIAYAKKLVDGGKYVVENSTGARPSRRLTMRTHFLTNTSWADYAGGPGTWG